MHERSGDGTGGALCTDLYELTMIQGYFLEGMRSRAVFDMFFRRQPYDGGFAIFAGLSDLVDALEGLSFSQDDVDYLSSQGIFRREFLDYLSTFRFHGDVYAVDEGTVVFPNEPLLRVHGDIIEAQLVESLILNILNFQTLIATKAARVRLATGRESGVLEFGMRRAQGPDGAMSASRAAYIGGCSATSNTMAGKRLGIPVSGTMAHSWIMAFPDELTAFRKFAEHYPDNAILLIDTYDTLGSGIWNAITVGRELAEKGKSIGVRIDSGDLLYLSVEARKRLDAAGLRDAKIVASNELDEHVIHQLVSDGAPIDLWGVGTHLVTGGDTSALSGVYKLVSTTVDGKPAPVLKLSNTPEKATNPGVKQIYRFFNGSTGMIADLLALESEKNDFRSGSRITFHHPAMLEKGNFVLSEWTGVEQLLGQKMTAGRRAYEAQSLPVIRDNVISELKRLDRTYLRLLNPHIYKVSLSTELKSLKNRLIEEYQKRYTPNKAGA